MFLPPTHCPCCDSELQWKKDQLYCLDSECSAKQSKQVEHFVKTLKIKGLGPETIKKLGLTSILDIYSNDFSALSSDKIAEKLRLEVEKSKSSPLNEVLPGFGIPLVGKSATQKLSQICNSIFDIDEETCRTAGLGEKTTNNLLDWIATNLDEYLELPFDFLFKKEEVVSAAKGVVCITGKLKSYKTKSAAKEVLQSAGWTVVDSVTKAVTHLVNESGVETTKTKKASDSGVIIVETVAELL